MVYVPEVLATRIENRGQILLALIFRLLILENDESLDSNSCL